MRSISMRVAFATAAAGALLAAAGPVQAEVAASGDPALYWNQVLSKGLPGGPVVSSRGYAMVSAAIHDAVANTTGRGNHAFMPGVGASGGDTRAALSCGTTGRATDSLCGWDARTPGAGTVGKSEVGSEK